ncbi:MAG: hypothetical protein QGH83_01865 [Candidatus Pacebacteria bacterium]|nr:hypothetical protein [Candidatus Paceibacterota bacterium]
MGKSEIELRIDKLSDDELLEMVQNKSDFTQEAIQYAKSTLEERGLEHLTNEIELNDEPLEIQKDNVEQIKRRKTMAEETTQGNPETAKNNTLTDKYAILHVFQSILWIILVVDLAGGFIAGINVLNISGMEWEILIVGIVWMFGLFGIYCGIKSINFLFDLDKVKSARV